LLLKKRIVSRMPRVMDQFDCTCQTEQLTMMSSVLIWIDAHCPIHGRKKMEFTDEQVEAIGGPMDGKKIPVRGMKGMNEIYYPDGMWTADGYRYDLVMNGNKPLQFRYNEALNRAPAQ